MKEYKFYNFYYAKDKSNEHYLDEIVDLPYDKYAKLYKGQMYCPICKTPQLMRSTSAKGEQYLKTYPKQTHLIDETVICPYFFKSVKNSHGLEFNYTPPKNAKNLLDSIIRNHLNYASSEHEASSNSSSFPKKTFSNTVDEEKKKRTKRMPSKYNINKWGENIPQNQLLIVHGRVYITLHTSKKNNNNQIFIHFNNISTHKLITSCTKPNGIEITEGYYYFAAMGQCVMHVEPDRTYYNLRLLTPMHNFISFSPI